ncbi:MAG: Holliday junction branch migration protein RuvA [Bacteroidaceae bacterium]|jgi:Holliday junction DNA helicase RuvA|nr:Holliday junction branch migration protein RuvA [Bacteroidaceae bacterium]
MIDYVHGIVDELSPTTATIDCHGVGYFCNISLNTYTAIQGKSEARLYVYESIREDAWVLFGFASKEERALFLMLISVSGVGGNTARTILSSYSPAEVCDIITTENEKFLKSVKGLGTKTAQRIIVELKDKVASLNIQSGGSANQLSNDTGITVSNKEVHDEAIEALKMLGFPPAPVTKTVRTILKDQPDAAVENVIKLALKMLK